MIYFFNCNWVDARCQQYSTHLHTIRRTTQSTQTIHRTIQLTNWEECEPYPVFANLTFALDMRKKQGKTAVRVAEECQLAR